ncbi:hypothetical protein [Lederbergia panacisoli]|uniref:hypothetical protein n=1 Tax=Lederbergia panacisoli TaxID=1255251 RepID=UPI00214B7F89|nr:hypothetical protein [Lederbergia panacisoli]MCR2822260.1 hypothetical protein [Lederbergia panacisoli]
MDKRLNLILGSIFILTSGLLYSIERIISLIYWSVLTRTGEYPTIPPPPNLLDNLFVPLFFIVGAIFFFAAFKKEIWKMITTEKKV